MITIAEEAPQTQEDARAAFLAERMTGIGGSDAASILGVNPWKTAFALWEEKTGKVPQPDLSANSAVQWGNRLEAVVADAYTELTGNTVHRVNSTLRHPQHTFMMAHLDRRVVGQKRGLEVKTAGFWAGQSDLWGESGTDHVPKQYITQVQHYMAVTGYEAFDLAVLLAGQDLRIYNIPRSEELIAAMIEAEAEFWRKVCQDEAPPITSLADAKRMYPFSTPELEVQASAEIAKLALDFKLATEEKAQLEKRIEDMQGLIAGFMADADTLVRGTERLVTYKSQTRKSFVMPESSFRVMRPVKASAK